MPPLGLDQVVLVQGLRLGDTRESEGVAPLPVLDDPRGSCLEIERRRPDVRVGLERHLRSFMGNLRDLAYEPVGGDDGVVAAGVWRRAPFAPPFLLGFARP